MRKPVWAILAVAGLGIALWIAASLLPSREPSPSASPVPREPHSASDASAAPAEAPVTTVAPSRTPATIEVERVAEDSWIVRGTVERGPQDPFPGARFRALLVEGYDAAGDPARDELVRADESGAFSWELPPPAGAVVLRFRAADSNASLHASERLVAKGEGPPQDIRITLYSFDRFVEGTVSDFEGRPLPGAEVFAYETPRARAGEDGRYEIAVPSIGSQIRLTAQAPGFAQQDATAEAPSGATRARVDFRLKPEFRITGKVLDESGRPIEGAKVRTIFTREHAAVTDKDGRFTLGNLDPGRPRHMLYARREGFVETRVDVETSGVERVQDLVLRRGARVEGFVYDPSGAPVAGAQLVIGFVPGAYNRLEAVSRENGSFAFPSVGHGEQNLFTQARGFAPEGYATGRLPRVVAEVEPSPGENVIRLARGASITGEVLDAVTDRPLSDATVKLASGKTPRIGWGDDTHGRPLVRTDADGTFRLENVPEGRHSLVVDHAAYAPRNDGPFEVSGGAVHRVVRLGVGATLTGILLDAAGNPLADGDVSLYAKSASAQVGRMWTTRADAQGGFVFERLPVGEYQVDHQIRRGWVVVSPVRTVVALSEGETKSIELRPRGSATIRGGVTSSETLPPVLPVSLMPARSPDGRRPLLDPIVAGRGALAEGGAFEFLAVEPGTYQVLVSFHDIETNRNWSGLASVSVAAGETAEVTVEVRPR